MNVVYLVAMEYIERTVTAAFDSEASAHTWADDWNQHNDEPRQRAVFVGPVRLNPPLKSLE